MANAETMMVPAAGEVARSEFGASELSVQAETASSAVAAQAQAAIQSRYIVAQARPRDWDDVRTKLLKDCKRPGFAAAARYRKPIGQGIEGPSIRFAEAAMRAMGNILPEVQTVFDDAQKRIVRVGVTDLEANLTYSKDVVVSKTVERRKLQKGQVPIGSRQNSGGQTVYIVEATDDDILNKENALISKALRTNGLRLLPGDILDECMEQVIATVTSRAADDPDAARKRIADAFAELSIQPSDLKRYLGCGLDQASPQQLVELRGLYEAIRNGEATWAEVLDSVEGASEEGEQDAKKAALADKLKKARTKRGASKGKAAEPEVDPATGEVIPDDVGAGAQD